MTFVYEKISEQDKERIDFSKIKVGLLTPNRDEWAINHELDAFLIFLIQEREPPHEHWYAFWWQGQVVGVAVIINDGPNSEDGKPTINGKIINFWSSGNWFDSHPEKNLITKKIREALAVHLQAQCDKAPWGTVVGEITVENSN
ncbi:hypothetical protein [Nostoc sp. PA-18-2419]|uniref:hypothetical protein n=1 Tax=Nostoc sp. PA-18-2419 TaxID=2575443 RepID=UPI001109AA15|nr:hypothetical protein [Nostoc sp. PA-18-2419]